jgi:hypothetical protein
LRELRICLGPITSPEDETLSERAEEGPSPWGGLSGALMFYRGNAIGLSWSITPATETTRYSRSGSSGSRPAPRSGNVSISPGPIVCRA